MLTTQVEDDKELRAKAAHMYTAGFFMVFFQCVTVVRCDHSRASKISHALAFDSRHDVFVDMLVFPQSWNCSAIV